MISGRTLSEREKLLGMSAATLLVVFFFSNILSVVLTGVGVGITSIVAHGVMRTPDVLFLDDGAAPPGAPGESFFSFLAVPAVPGGTGGAGITA